MFHFGKFHTCRQPNLFYFPFNFESFDLCQSGAAQIFISQLIIWMIALQRADVWELIVFRIANIVSVINYKFAPMGYSTSVIWFKMGQIGIMEARSKSHAIRALKVNIFSSFTIF